MNSSLILVFFPLKKKKNVGDTGYLKLPTQFIHARDCWATRQEHHEEIIGCLRQRSTCGWGLYIAGVREAEATERTGGSVLFKLSTVETLLLLRGRPSDNPLFKGWGGSWSCESGPHTHSHTHICWKTSRASVTVWKYEGKSAGSSQTPHPATQNGKHEHRATVFSLFLWWLMY